MTHSLQDILNSRVPQEPPEVAVIKQFVRDEFSADCGVLVHQNQLIIQVYGSALAGALRPHLHSLKEACQTDKRLLIRVGGQI